MFLNNIPKIYKKTMEWESHYPISRTLSMKKHSPFAMHEFLKKDRCRRHNRDDEWRLKFHFVYLFLSKDEDRWIKSQYPSLGSCLWGGRTPKITTAKSKTYSPIWVKWEVKYWQTACNNRGFRTEFQVCVEHFCGRVSWAVSPTRLVRSTYVERPCWGLGLKPG